MEISLVFKNIKDILGPNNRLILYIKNKSKELNVHQNFETVDFSKYDGITIIGEEPFNQYKNLVELIKILSNYKEDILVYTHFNISDLLSNYPNIQNDIFSKISVLVSGKYIKELDQNERLRESINQSITCFKSQYFKTYNNFNKLARIKCTIKIDDKIYSVGLRENIFTF